MSACQRCGTAARPTDKFCNACGNLMARPVTDPPAGPYGAPVPPYVPAAVQPGFGAPPARAPGPRCQMGHEIAPGTSYCPQGHPIAVDQIQFAVDPHGAPAGYGAPPAGPYVPGAAPYGTPPPGAPAFGGPQAQPARGVTSDVPPRALRGFLVAFGSNVSGDFWPLTGGRLLVGRSGGSEADIALPDPTISSRHAAILVDASSGTIAVEDSGSTNGTFVNDEHLGFNGRRDLRDGDRIRFGAYTTIVKVIGRP